MNLSYAAIERLRSSLPVIRYYLGWSAEHLANLLDVSRVTIVNLENTKGRMTRLQYLAVRALLLNEAETNNNTLLSKMVAFLVDLENVPDSMREELCNQVVQTAKTVGRKPGIAAVAKQVSTVIWSALEDTKLSEITEEAIRQGQAYIDAALKKQGGMPVDSIARGGENHDCCANGPSVGNISP